MSQENAESNQLQPKSWNRFSNVIVVFFLEVHRGVDEHYRDEKSDPSPVNECMLLLLKGQPLIRPIVDFP